jgi:hypothetical protein
VTHLTDRSPRAREAGLHEVRTRRIMEIVIASIVLFAGVVYGYYTVDGSGIAETPYGKIYGGAPGAIGPSSVSGKDDRVSMHDWTRGTR